MRVLSRLVLFLTLFSFVAQPVIAGSLTSNDLNFAFGGKAAVSKTVGQPSQQLTSIQPLSDNESNVIYFISAN